jgi:flagellar motor component MotA
MSDQEIVEALAMIDEKNRQFIISYMQLLVDGGERHEAPAPIEEAQPATAGRSRKTAEAVTASKGARAEVRASITSVRRKIRSRGRTA